MGKLRDRNIMDRETDRKLKENRQTLRRTLYESETLRTERQAENAKNRQALRWTNYESETLWTQRRTDKRIKILIFFSKKYPMIIYVYGGPESQAVDYKWSVDWKGENLGGWLEGSYLLCKIYGL